MTAPTIIGDCTLYLGDCMDILPTLGKVDAVLCDPPYGIDYGKQIAKTQERFGWNKHGVNEWDKDRISRDCIDALLSVSSSIIIWGGNYYTDYLPPTMQWLVWDKGQREFSLADCEFAWSSQWKASRIFNYSRAEALRDGKEHPTQKPLALMEWCLSFLPKAKTILDPFMGSGTTGVACIRTGRKFIGIEKEPKYFDIACKRIKAEYERTALFEPPPVVVVPTLFPVEGSPCEQS